VKLVGAIAFALTSITLTSQLPTLHKIFHLQIRCAQKQNIRVQSAGSGIILTIGQVNRPETVKVGFAWHSCLEN
jgi:hypothetical protein